MLVVSVLVNVLTAVNILLLDGFNSGVVVCLVAVLQLLISIWHEYKKPSQAMRKNIFSCSLCDRRAAGI